MRTVLCRYSNNREAFAVVLHKQKPKDRGLLSFERHSCTEIDPEEINVYREIHDHSSKMPKP